MKQKLKEGDVVMILPHESRFTGQFIYNLGVIKQFNSNRFILVEVSGSYPTNWAFSDDSLLKIGTL